MKNEFYIVLFSCLAILSCKESDFHKVSSEIERKLVVFGDGITSLKDATCIDISFSVKEFYGVHKEPKKNSIFLTDANTRMFGETALANDLNTMVSGDSVVYKVNYSVIKNQVLDEFINEDVFLLDTARIFLTVKCNLAMTNSEYLAYKEKKVREGLKLEMELINEFLDSQSNKSSFKRKGDLFYMKTKAMNSNPVMSNSDIAVAYTCSFLNGEIFHEVTSTEPQHFNINSPDQLIAGLESVVKEMTEGEECRVIIPSYLAFGENGSTDGTVPPKTPIMADIKLLEIYK